MDLSNVRAKLQTQNFAHYQTFNEFVGDCRLIFENCAIFNEVSASGSLSFPSKYVIGHFHDGVILLQLLEFISISFSNSNFVIPVDSKEQ